MDIENVFGYDIFKFKCLNKKLYTNELLSSNLQKLFDLPLVQNRTKGTKYDSALGETLTTVGNEKSDIINLDGAQKLVDWITQSILKTNPQAKEILYARTWANRMFRGSQGYCHAHVHPDFTGPKVDFVAIFYLNVPENGSNLVFVKDGEFNTFYNEYPADRIHILQSKTGELVIHSPFISHAVTIHNNDEPRECLVFEGYFK